MAEVCRDERRIEREGMRRNGGIEILNPGSTAFQGRLDAAEHPADGIGPLGAWEFRGDEIEARLQRRPALRPRQPFDAKRDLRNHRLRYRDVGRRGCGQSFDDGRAAFHERRKGSQPGLIDFVDRRIEWASLRRDRRRTRPGVRTHRVALPAHRHHAAARERVTSCGRPEMSGRAGLCTPAVRAIDAPTSSSDRVSRR